MFFKEQKKDKKEVKQCFNRKLYQNNGDGTVTIHYKKFIRLSSLRIEYDDGRVDKYCINRSDIIFENGNEIIFRIYETSELYYPLFIKEKENEYVIKTTYIVEGRYAFNAGKVGGICILKKEVETEEKIYTGVSLKEIFSKNKPYRLIETEEELDNYLNSNLSCKEWCSKKAVTTMIELNLGEGFISNFADEVSKDLDRYKTLIRLAEECDSKDVLMYLLVESFKRPPDYSFAEQDD